MLRYWSCWAFTLTPATGGRKEWRLPWTSPSIFTRMEVCSCSSRRIRPVLVVSPPFQWGCIARTKLLNTSISMHSARVSSANSFPYFRRGVVARASRRSSRSICPGCRGSMVFASTILSTITSTASRNGGCQVMGVTAQ